MPRHKRMSAIVLVLLATAAGLFISTPASSQGVLSIAQQQKLNQYAAATVRYFTSAEANNTLTGFTHAYFGTGKFQVKDGNIWREEYWDLTRGYGSHVNINEVALRFMALAAAYKMGWLTNFQTEAERYNQSWGQIKLGLQTLRAMQTSGNPLQFKKTDPSAQEGHFHRTYQTCINRTGVNDDDRTVAETVSNEDIQSSDDNALSFMNLCILEGLAGDQTVTIPDRNTIVSLCQQIRAAIDLNSFVIDGRIILPWPMKSPGVIIHNFTNGEPSLGFWDRVSTEGAVILAALLLSRQISTPQFYEIRASLKNYPVDWQALAGNIIPIGKPNYHAALFMHGLRHLHGLPTTPAEFSGLNYLETSLKPVLMAHLDFANYYAFQALGTQVMSQELYGVPILCMPPTETNKNPGEAQFPGNESNFHPVYAESLSRATGPHAWFIPLARWRYLEQTVLDQLFAMMAAYENEFFHAGSDSQLGWEATIPWTPDDTFYAWKASDGKWKYTDAGRPYEALNAAYIVLSIFDALNPDRPLASYHVFNHRLKRIAAYFDNGTPLAQPIAPILLLLSGGEPF